jgi:DNA-binding transcriptional LysR family regulator
MSLSEHLEKLRHFHKVADFRSINEASKAMGLSQAGLSKSISSLESALGISLFVRSNEGLVITSEGEMVLRTARKILGDAASLEANLKSLQAPTSPQVLRVGMYDSVAVYLFTALSDYMKIVYPSVTLRLFVETSSNLAEALKRNDVDLAIGVNLQSRKISGSEFFLLFEDYYSFYVSSKLEDSFGKMPILIHPKADDLEGVSVDQHLSDLIDRRGAHQVHNFETLKTLTIQGLGVGVLPTQVAKPLVELKQLRGIQIPKTKHLFGLHNIGFLAGARLMEKHREFAQDLYRLGQHWTKS